MNSRLSFLFIIFAIILYAYIDSKTRHLPNTIQALYIFAIVALIYYYYTVYLLPISNNSYNLAYMPLEKFVDSIPVITTSTPVTVTVTPTTAPTALTTITEQPSTMLDTNSKPAGVLKKAVPLLTSGNPQYDFADLSNPVSNMSCANYNNGLFGNIGLSDVVGLFTNAGYKADLLKRGPEAYDFALYNISTKEIENSQSKNPEANIDNEEVLMERLITLLEQADNDTPVKDDTPVGNITSIDNGTTTKAPLTIAVNKPAAKEPESEPKPEAKEDSGGFFRSLFI